MPASRAMSFIEVAGPSRRTTRSAASRSSCLRSAHLASLSGLGLRRREGGRLVEWVDSMLHRVIVTEGNRQVYEEESTMLVAHGEPAGGAALAEILWATGVAAVIFLVLGLFGAAHRSGRTKLLTNLGGFAERVSGLPAWAAIPAAFAGGALLLAVFGFYWDVATHIDSGRDPGPFANPSHYFIIFGLLGIAVGGYLGALLGVDPDSPTAVKVRDGWWIPVGSILLMVCGLIAVAGFPLDDMWHRLFGQDVTLWGPTHIQMVGGAALSTL